MTDPTQLFSNVTAKLQRPSSTLHHCNAVRTCLALLQEAAGLHMPVIDAYRSKLDVLLQSLHVFEAHFPISNVRVAIHTYWTLEFMERKLRPALKAIHGLQREVSDDSEHRGVMTIIQTLEDLILWSVEEISHMKDMCQGIKQGFGEYRSIQQNQVLCVLTLVTVGTMPMGLLSGYFGMNFVLDDGTPAVPLLRNGWWGVTTYWLGSIALTVTVISIYCFTQARDREMKHRKMSLSRVNGTPRVRWKSNFFGAFSKLSSRRSTRGVIGLSSFTDNSSQTSSQCDSSDFTEVHVAAHVAAQVAAHGKVALSASHAVQHTPHAVASCAS
mmetsp:Transcript_63769/g.106033  ORF Transcript_63769/g.106033 Transcript_63769/m.106033 type:complete len:327 (-) Transcript_63769:444-1424(-)